MESAASRRWPPIVAAAAGAVLIFLVLPNPLNVPQQNPSASAEYAPVPGKQQEAQTANFAQTSTATSAGIGAGGEGIGALPGVPPPALPEFKPRQKHCVGNPPRQTEDPLSPPCVPFFDGENGGATFPGVTKDDITVIFYNDRCCEGDLTVPWKPSDENQCTSSAAGQWECDNTVRTIKAHIRYFQARYQTYERTVRVIGARSSGNVGGTCASRKGDASQQVRQHEPFAVVSVIQGNAHCYVEEMSDHRIPVFGLNEDLYEKRYEEVRPYAFGFMPTLEVQTSWSASFICRKLRGETAKHAGDPLYHNLERKFGFIMPDGVGRGAENEDSAKYLIVAMKRECGMEFDLVRTYDYSSSAAAGSREASNILSEFKRATITTVVCYCIPVATENTAPTMMKTATGLAYFPEWFWDQNSANDRGIWMRTNGAPEQKSFGTTYFWRQPAFRQQFHYQAYLQVEPGSQPSSFWSYRFYHLMLNLFQGIQAAGPNLTPETIEQGMFTFNYLDRGNPWVPIGGYGPYGPNAISNYTFIDTGMAWWWDPAGTPPGGQRGEGCMRAVRGGLRYYPGEWPRGDTDLFHSEDQCTQDLYRIADPGSSTQV